MPKRNEPMLTQEQLSRLGRKLRARYLTLKLTQFDVADWVCVDVSTFRRWLEGESEPSLTSRQWELFAEILEVDKNALMAAWCGDGWPNLDEDE